ncbi:uncharacterized protein LOC124277349 [Haliotis rubra]|uniref:uncharacterized protein LOC124277349 n=1 Tax=Haliotis rubra TaxID=36100 RepID=UPI001EE5A389|nr:uncharacterized protein LOC124277349 [Haliotis rubra]
MIPTGSSNGNANELCGNGDIETAALYIITGCRTFKNIASISQGGKHLGFWEVILGHGFWSDIMGVIEDRRLGWFRYTLAGLVTFLRSRSEFNIRIDYLPYDPPTDGGDVDKSNAETEPVWKTIEGRYTGLMSFPTLVRPQKNTPKCVFDVNAEAMTLLMEKQCGRLTFLSYMNKLTQLHTDTFSYDFVTTLQVKSFRLRVLPTEGATEREKRLERTVSLDGELHKVESGDLDITVKLHRNLLEMFGAGTIAEE